MLPLPTAGGDLRASSAKSSSKKGLVCRRVRKGLDGEMGMEVGVGGDVVKGFV